MTLSSDGITERRHHIRLDDGVSHPRQVANEASRDEPRGRITIARDDTYRHVDGAIVAQPMGHDFDNDPTWWRNGSYGRPSGREANGENDWNVTRSQFGSRDARAPTPLRSGPAADQKEFVNTIENQHVA